MKCEILLIIAAVIIIGGVACAEDEKAWRGSGEMGFLMTTGNAETESVNTKAGLKYENTHLLSEINLAALYSSEETETDGETEKVTSAEKYNADAKIGYKLRPVDYVFFNAAYEDDRFSGYDYRSNYAAGYGRKLVNNDTVKLNIEVGPGYRYDKLENGQTEDETVFRGYLMFLFQLSKQAAFQQEVTVLAGPDNTGTKSITALKSQIAGALSLKATYTVDHNAHVPEDKAHTETETALTLVYDF